MPLSKARMRERKRLDRVNVKPKSNLNTFNDVKPKLEAVGLKIEGNKVSFGGKGMSNPIPLYNPAIHRPGDRVLIQRGKRTIEAVIPTVDADGNPIPDY